jgi:hypothetical protein
MPHGRSARVERLAAALLLTVLLVPGCTLLSMLDPEADPLCRDRRDAAECSAALEAIRQAHAFAFELERHTLRVDAVKCDVTGCTTALHVIPPADECLPVWYFGAHRTLTGPWQADASLHGDPACPFED